MSKALIILSIIAAIFYPKELIKKQDNDAALLVFYQAEKDSSFLKAQLPWLREVAENQQLDLKLYDEKIGFPEKVTSTPALIFLGKNGKALFGGKFRERTAVENFARISRLRPVPSQPDKRLSIMSMNLEQQKVVIPLKITAQKRNYATTLSWDSGIKKAFESGTAFKTKDTVLLWPGDRRYYLDVHPWVESDGRIFLSAAIFSQFDCINAVWNNFESPLSGTVEALDALLNQLALTSDSVITEYLSGRAGNESLSPLARSAGRVALATLSELSVYQAEQEEKRYPALSALSYKNPKPLAEALPMLSFNFPAPLDRYAGEVKKLDASIRFSENRSSISGTVVAEVKSMTMGMKDLDKKVLKSYLYAKDFPQASFDFENVPMTQSWQGGSALQMRIPGTFEMIGKRQPLVADAIFEPVQQSDGSVALGITASFELDISDPFGLTGPDGREELRNTMQFQLYTILQSK
jgi:polyisoprenoid-binding protein YceI